MKIIKLLTFIFLLTLFNCSNDDDSVSNITPDENQNDNTPEEITFDEINDFVWRGMNFIYVYKDRIINLANDRFTSEEDYANYLNNFDTPEDLFESLLYLPESVDEFSAINSNYVELEQSLQGITLNNGMEFGLVRFSNSDNIFGYVRYVLPNSSAATQGVTRGMLFTQVNGIDLTVSNFIDLLFGSDNSYTITLADYNESSNSISTNPNNTITLSKEVISENPIHINDVLEVNGTKIGYLMYNGFRSSTASLSELNGVFADFNSQNIDDLVLDLRYNGGGSVLSSIYLSSMITGQFTGETFFTEQWNNDFQTAIQDQNPDALINPFVDEMVLRDSNGDITLQEPINSLGLQRVFILTTTSTASASELVINGLDSHIEVIQIGEQTRGKPQASITIYDSENFLREGANPNHTYALQPLVYEAANSDGFSQYYDGLPPSIGFEVNEDIVNLGELGNPSEPLLERAIMEITGSARFFNNISSSNNDFEIIPDQNFKPKYSQEMFDEFPRN